MTGVLTKDHPIILEFYKNGMDISATQGIKPVKALDELQAGGTLFVPSTTWDGVNPLDPNVSSFYEIQIGKGKLEGDKFVVSGFYVGGAYVKTLGGLIYYDGRNIPTELPVKIPKSLIEEGNLFLIN